MRVFFASCITDSKSQERISAVIECIGQEQQIAGSYIYNLNNGDRTAKFSSLAEDILSSDIYIAEMSLPSQTLGFQIAFALNNGKPCLYLYDENTNGKPAVPILGHPSRMLKVSSYGKSTLVRHLNAFYKLALSQLASKRTSFMSTHEIDIYLDTESRRLGVPKAEVIRQSLHNAAQKKAQ